MRTLLDLIKMINFSYYFLICTDSHFHSHVSSVIYYMIHIHMFNGGKRYSQFYSISYMNICISNKNKQWIIGVSFY